MKKIISFLIFNCLVIVLQAQDVHAKDSCANSDYFQVEVRASSLVVAGALLQNAGVTDTLILRYSQMVTASPKGFQYPATWLLAMTYGTLASDASVTCATDINTIQQIVGNIYVSQAYAFYGVIPSRTREQEMRDLIRRILRNH